MIGHRTAVRATIAVAALLAAAAPARADDDGWRQDQGRHGEWHHGDRDDEWRHNSHGEWGYNPPRFAPTWNAPFAYAPPPYYYAAPPPPVYYAPHRYYRYGY